MPRASYSVMCRGVRARRGRSGVDGVSTQPFHGPCAPSLLPGLAAPRLCCTGGLLRATAVRVGLPTTCRLVGPSRIAGLLRCHLPVLRWQAFGTPKPAGRRQNVVAAPHAFTSPVRARRAERRRATNSACTPWDTRAACAARAASLCARTARTPPNSPPARLAPQHQPHNGAARAAAAAAVEREPAGGGPVIAVPTCERSLPPRLHPSGPDHAAALMRTAAASRAGQYVERYPARRLEAWPLLLRQPENLSVPWIPACAWRLRPLRRRCAAVRVARACALAHLAAWLCAVCFAVTCNKALPYATALTRRVRRPGGVLLPVHPVRHD